jgi:hypothetical protein
VIFFPLYWGDPLKLLLAETKEKEKEKEEERNV